MSDEATRLRAAQFLGLDGTELSWEELSQVMRKVSVEEIDELMSETATAEREVARLREELGAARHDEQRARDLLAAVNNRLAVSEAREERAVGLLREALDAIVAAKCPFDVDKERRNCHHMPQVLREIARSAIAAATSTPAPVVPPIKETRGYRLAPTPSTPAPEGPRMQPGQRCGRSKNHAGNHRPVAPWPTNLPRCPYVEPTPAPAVPATPEVPTTSVKPNLPRDHGAALGGIGVGSRAGREAEEPALSRAAVPATTPVCGPDCGKMLCDWPVNTCENVRYDDNLRYSFGYCSPECRDLGHPRNPPPTRPPESR